MMEKKIFEYLKNHEKLIKRIYPLKVPEKAELPVIVYQKITNTTDVLHDGPSRLNNAIMQFDVWANSYAEAKQIAKNLIKAMLEFRHESEEGKIWVTALNNENDFYESELGLYRVNMDFRIFYN